MFFQSRIPKPTINKEFLKPPEKIKYFTFGYNDLFAASLWLRLVQNIDYCEGGRVQDTDYVEPTKPVGEQRLWGILERKMKPSRCHLGWVYSMMDVITEIQPRFKLVYDPGATMLSVTVDDREGASRIFEKGFKQYPADWQLYFKAGYHYLWEVQDANRAADLYERAAKYGAPQWAASLSARLYTRSGKAEIARAVLIDTLHKHPKTIHSDRLRERLKEVEAILRENNQETPSKKTN